jgi:hypothetical protein
MNCSVCGHDFSTDHPLRACRVPGCPCLRAIADRGGDIPLETIGWQGCVLTGIVELIAEREEGTVHVSTDDGRECVVKVSFRPLAPYTCAGGKA